MLKLIEVSEVADNKIEFYKMLSDVVKCYNNNFKSENVFKEMSAIIDNSKLLTSTKKLALFSLMCNDYYVEGDEFDDFSHHIINYEKNLLEEYNASLADYRVPSREEFKYVGNNKVKFKASAKLSSASFY